MQLFSWSPTTFHAVYNVDNCGIYVLRKDLTKPGCSPYCLDAANGDLPKSSIDIMVKYYNKDDPTIIEEKIFKLHDYLNIPPPRMSDIRINIVKETLVAQNPEELYSVDAIVSMAYMPFYLPSEKEALNKTNIQVRTSLMVGNTEEKQDQQLSRKKQKSQVIVGGSPVRIKEKTLLSHQKKQRASVVTASSSHHQNTKPVLPESSNRWPISYSG